MLSENKSYTDIHRKLADEGFNRNYGNLCNYCKSIIETEDVAGYKKSPLQSAKPLPRYMNRQDVLKYIWSGNEIDSKDKECIFTKFPILQEVENCVKEFREIYKEKSLELLKKFIQKYSICAVSNLKSFVNGLKQDLAAVENSVTSPYSNGILEGNNNRLKMIKRLMYGRAKLQLLKAKVLNR